MSALQCPVHFWISESESRSVVSNSLRPQGLYSPWNSPGQNTGVGSHSLLQRIIPTQGSNPGLPHCKWILYQLSQQGSPPLYWSSHYINGLFNTSILLSRKTVQTFTRTKLNSLCPSQNHTSTVSDSQVMVTPSLQFLRPKTLPLFFLTTQIQLCALVIPWQYT